MLRFTHADIMALRKPTRVLTEMLGHVEVVSEECLEPVVHLDPDEVIDIWNAASDHNRSHKDPRGRGRGRGRCKLMCYSKSSYQQNCYVVCGCVPSSRGLLCCDLIHSIPYSISS